jgi:hypothetical protein
VRGECSLDQFKNADFTQENPQTKEQCHKGATPSAVVMRCRALHRGRKMVVRDHQLRFTSVSAVLHKALMSQPCAAGGRALHNGVGALQRVYCNTAEEGVTVCYAQSV